MLALHIQGLYFTVSMSTAAATVHALELKDTIKATREFHLHSERFTLQFAKL